MAEPGEFELISRYFARAPRDADVTLGVGDDAALVRVAPGHELVLAVDMMVESRHFLPDADPEALGHKILAVNLSDIAAMGARPRWALLAGALPQGDPAWLDAFSRGLFALADAHGVTLVGGDTTRGPRNLCLTIAGDVPEGAAIRRAGAAVGDDVWVSGALGDAMLALGAIQARTTLAPEAFRLARARLERPTPRVMLGQALRGIASAMIDVSDGLTGDLSHVLEASGTGARIELSQVPRSLAMGAKLEGPEREFALACLLAGGDDYELLFTASQDRRAQLIALSNAMPVPLTRIGTIVDAGEGLVIRDERGNSLPALPRAFDHFA
jgi:thiamine-monophosphate kinase